MTFSRRTLVVENVSGATPTRDVEYEFDYYGPIKSVERSERDRICLVHMKYAEDAKYAQRKLDGIKMDGRRWFVDFANERDFRKMDSRYRCSVSPPRSRSASRGSTKDNKDEDEEQQ